MKLEVIILKLLEQGRPEIKELIHDPDMVKNL